MKSQVGLVVAGLALLVFAIGLIQTPQAQTQVATQQRATQNSWEYGRLIIEGDEATWQGGETSAPLQIFSVDGLYRRLGGRSRSNLTNLLNTIGNDGWELVATDEIIWTFKRQR